ncbi:hypothetical protein SEA_PAVLO_14 [Microbacterium phage Pavlo]|nr:hypothetical protein SEA_HUBBS_15 [Microbacterium phage Hubbs]UVG34071.1 hypothetical protein SEA_PAVLO_14 [Microbacterium phage Pavlo]
MDAEERAEYEQNRSYLIETAQSTYKITLEVVDDGLVVTGGTLNKIVEFYQDWRSEIEEML